MQQQYKKSIYTSGILIISCLILLFNVTSCKKFLDVPLPVNTIAGDAAFANDDAVAAVLNSAYNNLFANGYFIDGSTSVAYLYGLYGDELQNASTTGTSSNPAFYANAVQSNNTGGLWANMYKLLQPVNLTIEGATANTALNNRNQWLGEAYFLRAFIHFYLTNMYGEVPIVITSQYTTNNTLKRSPQADVYKQIIADLKIAQSILPAEYRNSAGVITADRSRPNRAAAAALLARTYLYTGDWANAESQADSVLNNKSYSLVPLAQVFLASSKEMIWGMAPGATSYTVKEATNYIINPGLTPVASQGASVAVILSQQLLNAFEAGDARRTSWVGVSNVPANGSTPAASYYFAYKYKTKPQSPALTAPLEYNVVLRRGEQFLIRAEARAQQNKLLGVTGARSDLDSIRNRAALAPATALSKPDLLAAIMHERQTELFVEGGHRFFDLRRTGALDAVMNTVAPMKGGTWQPWKQWWPILSADITANPNLIQTPNYQ